MVGGQAGERFPGTPAPARRRPSVRAARNLVVVTAAPDHRESTRSLRAIAAELRRRPQVRCRLLCLRVGVGQEPWPEAQVVDELRRWAPASALDRVGIARVAGWLRGARLRWWLRGLRRAVVVLDDGLGERILHLRPTVLVVRRNVEPTADAAMESPGHMAADLRLVPHELAANGAPAGEELLTPLVDDFEPARRALDPAWRGRVRRDLGLAVEGPLVVGWGDDGWLDGPDVFIRCLWALEHHLGVSAHGLWLGLGSEPDEERRLRLEARRCGLEDRFAVNPDASLEHRLCGDVVLLPYRAPAERMPIAEAVASGLEVIAFPSVELADPAVVRVDHLDVDAAAREICRALGGDRRELAASAYQRLDVRTWVDEFLARVAHIS